MSGSVVVRRRRTYFKVAGGGGRREGGGEARMEDSKVSLKDGQRRQIAVCWLTAVSTGMMRERPDRQSPERHCKEKEQGR